MPVLLAAEDIACAANLKVAHRNLKAGAELRKFAYRRQTLLRNLTQNLAACKRKVRVSAAGTAAHASAQLVQLRKSHAVGVVDDQGVRVWHVHARLNDRRADEHVNFMLHQTPPDFGELLLAHFAVADADPRLRHALANTRRHALNRCYVVVQVIHLPAAAQFFFDGVGDDARVIFHHVCLHRVTVVRRFFNDGHIAYTGKRHVQGARDRRCGKRQNIGRFTHVFQPFFLLHAEALLLVDDDKPEVFKLHVFRDQSVCADDEVNAAASQFSQNFVLLTRRAEAGEQLHIHGEALHTL